MKKYIGAKQIEAEPMTEAEACEAGLLRTESYRDLPGYKVVYEDGYESWSPKDVFENAYKVAETPLDRMIIEYNELMGKYNKLVLFIGRKDAIQIAGDLQVRLMENQMRAMKEYLLILRTRIELIGK